MRGLDENRNRDRQRDLDGGRDPAEPADRTLRDVGGRGKRHRDSLQGLRISAADSRLVQGQLIKSLKIK